MAIKSSKWLHTPFTRFKAGLAVLKQPVQQGGGHRVGVQLMSAEAEKVGHTILSVAGGHHDGDETLMVTDNKQQPLHRNGARGKLFKAGLNADAGTPDDGLCAIIQPANALLIT